MSGTATISRDGRAQCPGCLRYISTFIPKQGDGSARFFRQHKCKGGRVVKWKAVPGWEVSR